MWNYANITNDSIGWVGRWCESTNQNSFLIECHGLCWQSQNACPKRRFPVRTVKVKRRGQSWKFALVSILNKLFYVEVFKLYFWVRYFSKLTLKVYAYPQPQNNNWSITSIFFFIWWSWSCFTSSFLEICVNRKENFTSKWCRY